MNDFEMVPVAHIVTGIAFVCEFHMHCISTARYSYFRTFSASLLIKFLSPEIATSINTRSFFINADYDVRFLLGIVQSVCTC